MCSVQCTVYSVQGMVYSVQCTSFLFVPLLCFGDCTEVYLCMAEQSPGDIGPRSIYMGITSFYGGIMFLKVIINRQLFCFLDLNINLW